MMISRIFFLSEIFADLREITIHFVVVKLRRVKLGNCMFIFESRFGGRKKLFGIFVEMRVMVYYLSFLSTFVSFNDVSEIYIEGLIKVNNNSPIV